MSGVMCGTRRDFVAKGAKYCSIWHAAAGPQNPREFTGRRARRGMRHKACCLLPRGACVDLCPPHSPHAIATLDRKRDIFTRLICLAECSSSYKLINYFIILDFFIIT